MAEGHIICEGDRVAMDVYSEDDDGGLKTRTRVGTVTAVGTFDVEAHEFVPQGGGGVIAAPGEKAWALVWFDDDPSRDWPIPWPMLRPALPQQ